MRMSVKGSWAIVALVSLAGAGCDESPVEAELALAGGQLTVFDETPDAFGRPAPYLEGAFLSAFFVGNSFFRQNWVSAPASTTARDGLGPTFNARSCAACHFKDGRGAPPSGPDVFMAQGLVRISVPGPDGTTRPVPGYGGQLNPLGNLGIPGEGNPAISWHEVESGTMAEGEAYSLRAPTVAIEDPGFGPLPADLQMSLRMAPAVFGMGLLDAVDSADILDWEDAGDVDGDGISGRANRTVDLVTGEPAIGRFGWKASVPTLRQQNAAAFVGDMGLTSALFPEENCPAPQAECAAAPNGGDPELTAHQLDRVTHYTAHLAVPARRDAKAKDVIAGEKVFRELGCASCHREVFALPADNKHSEAGMGAEVFHPYSDLLLHDMGDGLADRRPDEMATGFEWRTAPLWGLGLIETVNGHTFLLHDGRARGVTEAILWHGGEAAASAAGFRRASRADRERLERFLYSL